MSLGLGNPYELKTRKPYKECNSKLYACSTNTAEINDNKITLGLQ